jgi:hypothetical protein
MDNRSLVIILIVALVLVGAVAVWLAVQRRRSQDLRRQFGPEYKHTLREAGNVHKAEAELAARRERVEQLHIRPLDPDARRRFLSAWDQTQARFVDDPRGAVTEADDLVNRVMQARGYPIGDFEQRAADISVDHPAVVEHYRAAQRVAEANRRGQAGTEDLRQALVRYRALFADLLDIHPPERKERIG